MRVLVVEDEPDLLRTIAQVLREDGYAVDEAADGQEGLYKATSWSYDAIVLDLGLTNYNTRNIAQHTHLMGKYLSGVIGVRMVLAGLYALLTVVVGLVLGYSGEQLGVLGWLVLNQALVASILYLRSNIAGAQRFRQDSLLSVLDRVLLIAAVVVLAWSAQADEYRWHAAAMRPSASNGSCGHRPQPTVPRCWWP